MSENDKNIQLDGLQINDSWQVKRNDEDAETEWSLYHEGRDLGWDLHDEGVVVPEDVPDHRTIVMKVADDEHRVQVGVALVKRGIELLDTENERVAHPLIDTGSTLIEKYRENSSNYLKRMYDAE
jgi:hypothetical protein